VFTCNQIPHSDETNHDFHTRSAALGLVWKMTREDVRRGIYRPCPVSGVVATEDGTHIYSWFGSHLYETSRSELKELKARVLHLKAGDIAIFRYNTSSITCST
jgi:hypothetical protein